MVQQILEVFISSWENFEKGINTAEIYDTIYCVIFAVVLDSIIFFHNELKFCTIFHVLFYFYNELNIRPDMETLWDLITTEKFDYDDIEPLSDDDYIGNPDVRNSAITLEDFAALW